MIFAINLPIQLNSVSSVISKLKKMQKLIHYHVATKFTNYVKKNQGKEILNVLNVIIKIDLYDVITNALLFVFIFFSNFYYLNL